MIRIGARKSPLARAQADQVAAALREAGVETEFVPISTQGDVDRRELTQIGGTGVFTGAVRDALLDGTIDVGVHSCKDLPTAQVDGLEVIAYPPREDTRDVLVGLSLTELIDRAAADHPAGHPAGPDDDRTITIGTGAPRRAVQLEQLAADRGLRLLTRPIRGNVETRLGLVRDGEVDAVVLAAAGLRRLGLLTDPDEPGAPVQVAGLPAALLDHDQLLPAPGQAALAIEINSSLDSENRRVLTRLDDAVTRAEVLAERRFLAVLEAGCTAPVGARAEVRSASVSRDPGTDLTLVAVLGRTRESDEQIESSGAGAALVSRGRLLTVSGHGSVADPAELGQRLAELALTRIDREDFPG